MYFIKRAWLYVRRKWGKVLTVGVILFVVSALVLTGLVIKSASQSTFERARNELGASVNYTTDLSSVMKGGGRPTEKGTGAGFQLPDDYTSITTKEIEIIAQSKYVKDYVISANLGAEAVDFSYYNPSSSTDEDESNDDFRPRLKTSANINVVGVDSEDKGSNFAGTITDGRYFTDEEISNAEEVVILEKTIAELNDIAVGDSITIERVNRKMLVINGEPQDQEGVEITYKVVGIYKTDNPTDITSSDFMGTFNLTENTMYAPYTTVLEADLAGLEGDELTEAKAKIAENGYTVQNVIFNLKDPSDIDAFVEEVKKMDNIDMTYRSLNANDEAYQQMVGPIESVASTSTVLVIVVVIAGAFIIALLSMLTIKDRKYELGVLLSLGESRIKIISQLITEMVIIAVVSFGLAALVSNFTAQGTTNYLLNQAISSQENEEENNRLGPVQFGNFGGGFITKPNQSSLANIDVETIDTLTVEVNIYDILKMFGIGIFIIIIGNVIQASFVLRCNPKEILLER